MKCIDEEFLCDGNNDCADASDEAFENNEDPCHTKQDKCKHLGTLTFKCDGVKCVRNTALCDGIHTCVDGYDETPQSCHTASECPRDKFQCTSTKNCIPAKWVCDRHIDCADSSDELQDCTGCPEFECSNKNCLFDSQICDGRNDCGDNSDEQNCTLKCKQDEYYCSPKGCINTSHICDGIIDCYNAEDELSCDKISESDNVEEPVDIECHKNEFKCQNVSDCIPNILRCDGIQDCEDHSDEVNCMTEVQFPQQPMWGYNFTDECVYPDRICISTGECIRVDKLCDGETDCADGSDEGFRCNEKICDHNTECSHFCHNAPEGFVCSCPSHLFLKPNGLQCSPEHACEHWGTCSQICEQHGKRYKCKCRDGFSLHFDQFTCKSDNTDSPYVIFSNRQEIRSVDLKTLAVRDLFSSLRNTIALDFLYQLESVQIFWTDVIDDKIYR